VTADVATGTEAAAPALPAAPTLRGALRAAAVDFYYNSWRLVPANILWGLGLIALYLVYLVWPPGALLLSPLLAVPTAGLYRLAALIVRGESVSFWDGLDAWRRYLVPALVMGISLLVAGTIFSVNVIGGLTAEDPVGWGFATFAGWGFVILGLLAVTTWPLLVDPQRAGWGTRRSLRLAAYLVVAHPLRLAGLAVVTAVLLLLSTVAFAALVTIALALAALLGSQYVLPSADRLEARLAQRGMVFAPELPQPIMRG
jgi:hypothetical protein